MHFPIYVEIGSVKILLHSILEVAGIFIGFRYFLYLRNKQNDDIDTPNRTWIIIGAIFGAVLGSRMIGSLENPAQFATTTNIFLYVYSNKTIVGGLLGGLIGVEMAKKLIKEKQSSGDLITYPLILGMIIGRIGCFSMGVYEETYGLPTSLPWGVNLGDELLRHPVSLYEIAFLISAWVLLRQSGKKFDLASGSVFKLFMIAHLSFRFLLDFIKPHYTYGIGLSTIQITCLAGLVYYYRYIIHPNNLLILKNASLAREPASGHA